MKPYLKFITSIICWFAISYASAQKLPAAQQASIYAPNHKAGGLLAALDNKFQAYNKGNHIYYTLANDDNNLYLSAYTTNKLTIQKIVRWGLALTVDRAKKIGRTSPSVSFPIDDGDKNLSIVRIIGAEVASKALYNSKMAKMCKLIAVKNLIGVDGPTISIYNSQGIKAIASFNDKLEYTYELTVPLKYLNISKDKARFHYDIMLNGSQGPVGGGMRRRDGMPIPNNNYLFSVTNFGGTYTLATK